MKVRLALPDDFPAFAALTAAAHAESLPHVPYSEAKVRASFERYLITAHPTITVAYRNGELVGFAVQSISEFPSGVGLYTTLEVIYVRPDRRGTRAAALLLRWFADWSDNVVGAVEATGGIDNSLHTERTAKFLAREGFEKVGFFMRRRKGASADGQERRN